MVSMMYVILASMPQSQPKHQPSNNLCPVQADNYINPVGAEPLKTFLFLVKISQFYDVPIS